MVYGDVVLLWWWVINGGLSSMERSFCYLLLRFIEILVFSHFGHLQLLAGLCHSVENEAQDRINTTIKCMIESG